MKSGEGDAAPRAFFSLAPRAGRGARADHVCVGIRWSKTGREISQMTPLAGLLVVSLEQAVAAPMCSCRLADAGARVIKIERPEGDFARGYDALVHGESAYFVWLNRGKESVVLDLVQAG